MNYQERNFVAAKGEEERDMARLRVAHTSWALTTKRKFNRPSDGFNGIASAACKIINDT